MKHCQVGMFKLPGIVFNKDEISPELDEEMKDWANANNCGSRMTDTLWSFKSEKKRTLFVLRWCEHMELE